MGIWKPLSNTHELQEECFFICQIRRYLVEVVQFLRKKIWWIFIFSIIWIHPNYILGVFHLLNRVPTWGLKYYVLITDLSRAISNDLGINHGINEIESSDDLFVKQLFFITEVKTSPVMAHRLGQKKRFDQGRSKLSWTRRSIRLSSCQNSCHSGPAQKKARIKAEIDWSYV